MPKSVSILNFNSSFYGNFNSKDDIHISGCNFEGNIFANEVCLKSNSNIKGCIYANKLLVYEDVNIEGQIVANEILVLKNVAIRGNVIYNNICIRANANINGKCYCLTQEEINKIIDEEKDKLFINNADENERSNNDIDETISFQRADMKKNTVEHINSERKRA